MNKLLIILSIISFNVFAEPVNINKADAKTISQSLQGIGVKKAEAIVQYRKKNGAFKTIDDLINVKGIGKKTIEKNSGDILVSKSKASKKSKKEKKQKKSK